MDFEELRYDLCPGCAERQPKGIIDNAMHSCPLNTYIYYGSRARFRISMFVDMIRGRDAIDSFRALLVYPHFKAMPNFGKSTTLEKRFYQIEREMEIKEMKRMRAYVELENKFYITGKL